MSPPNKHVQGNMYQGTLCLSIVIPAYNEEKRLPRTLDQVFACLAATTCTAEVIIVNDSSTDATMAVVRSLRQ